MVDVKTRKKLGRENREVFVKEMGGFSWMPKTNAANNCPAFLCAYLIVIAVLCFAFAEQCVALPTQIIALPKLCYAMPMLFFASPLLSCAALGASNLCSTTPLLGSALLCLSTATLSYAYAKPSVSMP